jgi:hypothetical protein
LQEVRAVWRKCQAWLLAHPERIGNIVFIDETGINTKMARLRGRCRRGLRMVASIPHGHWKTMTFIAGLRCDGLTAPWVIEGAMDGNTFETYISSPLAPTSKKEDVVVLDNLSAHKKRHGQKGHRRAWCIDADSATILTGLQIHGTRIFKGQGSYETSETKNN